MIPWCPTPPRETRAAGDNFAAGDATLRDDIAKLCPARVQHHAEDAVDAEPGIKAVGGMVSESPGRNESERYLLRPAVAQDRLRRLDDGRIVLTLKTAWADGTRHLVFEPLTLLEKLAALTPRPRINLVLYHGVLAPHAGWRAYTTPYVNMVYANARTSNLEEAVK